MKNVYLDSASGAPLHPRVIEGFGEALHAFEGLLANPNSLHRPAQRMKRLELETAELVLASLSLSPDSYRVLFTGAGTEAVQTAIRSSLFHGEGKRLWLQSAIEHSCNRDMMEEARERGVRVAPFPLNERGEPGWEGIEPSEGAGLLSLLSVQNETGITSHILSASAYAKQHHLQLCIDHVAGWGKVVFPFAEIRPEFIAVSGHKIGGFAGIGALVYRSDLQIHPLFPGSQQGGLRGGTENTAGILSLKLALEGRKADSRSTERVAELQARFEKELKSRFRARARIIGEGSRRSPYLTSVSFVGFSRGLDLVPQLDLMGISLSSGSACQSAVPRPSFVLMHYGLNEFDARNTLRVSLHDHSTWEDLEALLNGLSQIFSRIKS